MDALLILLQNVVWYFNKLHSGVKSLTGSQVHVLTP